MKNLTHAFRLKKVGITAQLKTLMAFTSMIFLSNYLYQV